MHNWESKLKFWSRNWKFLNINKIKHFINEFFTAYFNFFNKENTY